MRPRGALNEEPGRASTTILARVIGSPPCLFFLCCLLCSVVTPPQLHDPTDLKPPYPPLHPSAQLLSVLSFPRKVYRNPPLLSYHIVSSFLILDPHIDKTSPYSSNDPSKPLPYPDASIYEPSGLHQSIAFTLKRTIPAEDTAVGEEHFPEGTLVFRSTWMVKTAWRFA